MDDVELGRRILAQGLLPREVLTAAYARRGARSLEQVLLQDRLLSVERLRTVGGVVPPGANSAAKPTVGWVSVPAGDVTRLDDDELPLDADLEATQLDLNPPDGGPPAAAWTDQTRDPEASPPADSERTLIDNTVLTPPVVDLARMRAADQGIDATIAPGSDLGDTTRMDDGPEDAPKPPVDDSTRMDAVPPPAADPRATSSSGVIRGAPAADRTFAPGLEAVDPARSASSSGFGRPGLDPSDVTFAPGLAPVNPAASASSFGHPPPAFGAAGGATPTFAELGPAPNDRTFAPGIPPVSPAGPGPAFAQPAYGTAGFGAVGANPTFAELGPGPADRTFADPGASYEAPPLDANATFADVSRAGEPGFAPDPDVVQLPRAPGETGRLGPYLLLEELGRGGMGAVYRARDAAGREVAVKVIIGEFYSDTIKERFVREGQVTAALNHPGIVRVLGAGTVGKTPYLVYELVEGAQSFKSIYGKLPLEQQVELLRDAARALEAAHSRGVLHRDVKPDNLLVDKEGNVRVADFGLAAGKDLDRLTRTGAQLGTPAYMAPEQIDARREDLGPPTDVWALGVMLYEILTGERPFKGKSFKDLCLQITEPNPVLPRKLKPSVPRDLEAICLRCLHEKAAGRYPSAGALADDLDRALRKEQVDARPPPRFGKRTRRAALVLAALGLAGGALGAYATLGGGASQAPARELTISLTSPRTDGEVAEPMLEVTGRVQGPSEWVRVNVDVGLPAGDPAAPPSVRVRAGEVFKVAFSLPGGETRVRVFAEDESDPELSAEPVERRITYVTGPKWYRRIPPEERPPLFPGLVACEEAGEYRWEPDGSILVWCPPGTFTQGPKQGDFSLELGGEAAGGPGQNQTREVTLTRGYFLGKYEVSVGQWDRYARETGAQPAVRKLNLVIIPTELGKNEWRWGDGDDFFLGDTHPVLNINYLQARAYCEWAGLRLPTEAEWEYAACGGQRIKYPWGDSDPGPSLTNMLGREDGYPYTAPRAAFANDRSPFGAMNMGGNVSELVSDYYANFPPGPAVDPTGPETGDERVYRGGAWSIEWAPVFAVYTRDAQPEDLTDWRIGMRVALTPPKH
ncbi:MAG: SUMF1/EgtB/PvdO family nonheme iron enzyme [Planctomycetes bacterium]|nr:SUMF1/EgtB/PvdO family nonheme iron enzyme [Planctomycetota bacterium]